MLQRRCCCCCCALLLRVPRPPPVQSGWWVQACKRGGAGRSRKQAGVAGEEGWWSLVPQPGPGLAGLGCRLTGAAYTAAPDSCVSSGWGALCGLCPLAYYGGRAGLHLRHLTSRHLTRPRLQACHAPGTGARALRPTGCEGGCARGGGGGPLLLQA